MKKRILITGGAGFIGCNSAIYFMNSGWEVIVFDNLSRVGTDSNLEMLRSNGLENYVKGDLRDYSSIGDALKKYKPEVVLHLAGQVAVTTSVINPREDFDINALGTLNLLEACRSLDAPPFVIYSSTNKVYGGMEAVEIIRLGNRYEYKNLPFGVSETMQLDFHSPYGCSKGAADQYVRDYSRIFGVPGVVLRQSCIYGPNQFGIEDQGWVAWFTIATTLDKNITIFGDGMQIRDVLHVGDLVKLYEKCTENQNLCSGKVYNVGGGPEFTMSLLELVNYLQDNSGKEIKPAFGDWRPGDQKVFVSDIRKLWEELKWKPEISPREGVRTLADWVVNNKESIKKVLGN